MVVNSKDRMVRNAQIVKLAKEGMKLSEIGDRYNIRKSTVHRILGDIKPKIIRQKQIEEVINKKYYSRYGMDKEERNSMPSAVKTKLSRILANSRARAKKKNMEHNIQLKDLYDLYDGICPVLGIPYEDGGDYVVSIDRIYSDQGYVKGNIILMSWRANRIKFNATKQELTQLLNFLDKINY